MEKKFNKNLAVQEFEPRWFIWTITLLIVIGVSLSGYIIITAEQDSAQVLESTTPLHFIKK